MKRAFALVAAVAFGTAAHAHQLNVFAFVEGDTVNVESRFSNGNAPRVGEVRVFDGNNQPLVVLPLEEDGTAQFRLDQTSSQAGLLIEVSTGEGHDNYWILPAADIARGSQE